jgi:hypothetical protein
MVIRLPICPDHAVAVVPQSIFSASVAAAGESMGAGSVTGSSSSCTSYGDAPTSSSIMQEERKMKTSAKIAVKIGTIVRLSMSIPSLFHATGLLWLMILNYFTI